MVYGKGRVLRAAVLTAHAVSSKDVLARELDLAKWNPEVGAQPDDGGEWIIAAHRAYDLRRALLDHFSLCQKQQHQGFFCAADTNRLIRLIQYQHLRIKRRRGRGLFRISL